MIAVSKFTQCKWTTLYIGRWLKADLVLSDRKRIKRTQGTPQGVLLALLSPVYSFTFALMIECKKRFLTFILKGMLTTSLSIVEDKSKRNILSER
jgi:retron-type reverse transcriptase